MQMDRFVFVGVRERAPRHACDVRGDFLFFICGCDVYLKFIYRMRSCNEMHLMERLKRGLTPQVRHNPHIVIQPALHHALLAGRKRGANL